MYSALRNGRFSGLLIRGPEVRKAYGPLLANALMHLVNDGCFVALYPVLPLIAVEFSLSYAQVGMLKTALSGASTAFQLPMAILAERFGEIAFLALGMAWVAAGLMIIGLAGSFLHVLVLAFCAGTGGSVQHPVASSFVSRQYDGSWRASALGILNFAGDLGKFIVPAIFALSLPVYGWRRSLFYLGAASLLFSLLFWLTMRQRDYRAYTSQHSTAPTAKGWGILHPARFASLLSMGVLDASVRNALLTFVPFLLLEKGITEASASLMLTVLFAGGALGKLGCGLLANRLGTTRMIVVTEVLTGTFVLFMLPAQQSLILPTLFVLGFFLNGTSSILLDGVAELFDKSKRSRGYGLYFTIYLGAGALGPIMYGVVGDMQGLHSVFVAMALASLAIVPLAGLYHLSTTKHSKIA